MESEYEWGLRFLKSTVVPETISWRKY